MCIKWTAIVAESTRRRTSSLASILEKLQQGALTVKVAEQLIATNNETAGEDDALKSFANLDHDRVKRTGFPEAIFAAGKTPEQVASILDSMAGHVNKRIQSGEGGSSSANAILATRVDQNLYEKVRAIPLQNGSITYHDVARMISMKASFIEESVLRSHSVMTLASAKKVIVACAGTTDLPVAEEAAVSLEAAGVAVERVYDVGVAGLHRIINALPTLRHPDVRCVIVCAGMDGALPSVVAGLVSVPVVAVPTSVGYGASFGGLSAMLTMLNSCAPGVAVVNIDNGFGGAAFAYKCINSNWKDKT